MDTITENDGDTDIDSAVKSLQCHIKDTEHWISTLLESTQWSTESLLVEEDKVQCYADSSHFVPVSRLDSHAHYCDKAKQGYSKKELEKDQSSDFFYEKATTVVPIKLDPATVYSIVASMRGTIVTEDQQPLPETVDHYLSDLSPGERQKIYEYCIETAKTAQRLQAIKEEELMLLTDKVRNADKPTQKSRLEILAEARDQKRRRQSYKGKKVHTGKKSHTEILREVIDSQMDILRTMLSDEPAVGEKNQDSQSTSSRCSSVLKQDSSHKRKKHRSKSRSHSRERSRSQSRYKHSSSKKRKHRSRSKDRSHSDSKHKKKRHKHKHDKEDSKS